MPKQIELKSVFVRKAKTKEDIIKALDVRWEGYKKYFTNKEEMLKEPFLPNETLLLAVDDKDCPIGTMRILDRRFGKIELDKFIDVDSLLKDYEKPCAEATRVAVTGKENRFLIKIALWKAYYMYCSYNQIRTMLFSSRSLIAKFYNILFLEDLGEKGEYYHTAFGLKKHKTYKLNIETARNAWQTDNYHLALFMSRINKNIRYK